MIQKGTDPFCITLEKMIQKTVPQHPRVVRIEVLRSCDVQKERVDAYWPKFCTVEAVNDFFKCLFLERENWMITIKTENEVVNFIESSENNEI